MKKILIIAEGELAASFLNRLYLTRSNLHHYTIVTRDKQILPEQMLESFEFFEFDATSLSKLKVAVNGYFSQFVVVMANGDESMATYENLRLISIKTDIVMLDLWDLAERIKDDKHLELVDVKTIIASRFVDHLPDMPAVADNIGLGKGEIMEVKVPIGSSFMYRHVGSIQQKKWRIAMIYRAGEIILPKNGVMIRPNDTLLIVGEPVVLQSVFRLIKREPGQFPSPFGSNIYTILDMREMSEKRLNRLIDDSLYLHSKLNNRRLIFKILNPTFNEALARLRAIDDKNILVIFDYFVYDNSLTKFDIGAYDVGLLISDNGYFFKHKLFFYALKLPVLKVGNLPLNQINQGVILGDGNANIETQSAVIMDFSAQLDLEIKLYYFDTKNINDITLNEHFESLSALFEKSISIENSRDKNPILKLANYENFMQFISFDENIARDKFTMLSTNINRHYQKLSKNSQLFVPLGS